MKDYTPRFGKRGVIVSFLELKFKVSVANGGC